MYIRKLLRKCYLPQSIMLSKGPFNKGNKSVFRSWKFYSRSEQWRAPKILLAHLWYTVLCLTAWTFSVSWQNCLGFLPTHVMTTTKYRVLRNSPASDKHIWDYLKFISFSQPHLDLLWFIFNFSDPINKGSNTNEHLIKICSSWSIIVFTQQHLKMGCLLGSLR